MDVCPECGVESPLRSADGNACLICGAALPPLPSGEAEPSEEPADVLDLSATSSGGRTAADLLGELTRSGAKLGLGADVEPVEPTARPSPPRKTRAKAEQSEKELASLLQADKADRKEAKELKLAAAIQADRPKASAIPVIGILRALQAKLADGQSRLGLAIPSILTTAALVAAPYVILPGAEVDTAQLRHSIRAELEVVGATLGTYVRREQRIPSAEEWAASTRRADGRFFDPWGRPYVLQEEGAGFAIGTFGKDALEGGTGEDADLFLSFGGFDEADEINEVDDATNDETSPPDE